MYLWQGRSDIDSPDAHHRCLSISGRSARWGMPNTHSKQVSSDDASATFSNISASVDNLLLRRQRLLLLLPWPDTLSPSTSPSFIIPPYWFDFQVPPIIITSKVWLHRPCLPQCTTPVHHRVISVSAYPSQIPQSPLGFSESQSRRRLSVCGVCVCRDSNMTTRPRKSHWMSVTSCPSICSPTPLRLRCAIKSISR